MESLRGKVALVTGASSGIGLACVARFVREGARVVGLDLTEPHDDVDVPAGGAAVSFVQADVRDEDAISDAVSAAVAEHGRIDAVVTAAGVAGGGPAHLLDRAEWQRVLDVNLTGTFVTARAAARRMLAAGGGSIVNIASLAAVNPFAGGSAYNASKFGLLGFSEAAMLDLRHDGIRMATVLPGSVATEFGHPSSSRESSWMLQPGDVAEAVADLVRFPERAIPSRIDLRPSKPPK